MFMPCLSHRYMAQGTYSVEILGWKENITQNRFFIKPKTELIWSNFAGEDVSSGSSWAKTGRDIEV
jgi:hypothetical protein